MKKNKVELEDVILREVMSDNGCTVHFTYAINHKKGVNPVSEDNYDVKAMTFNPKTQESFLLKEVKNVKTHEEGLEEILLYVQQHKTDYNSFTVVWAKKGENQQKISSYFYCKDLLEALEKFYHDKVREDYIVYDTKMNGKS